MGGLLEQCRHPPTATREVEEASFGIDWKVFVNIETEDELEDDVRVFVFTRQVAALAALMRWRCGMVEN